MSTTEKSHSAAALTRTRRKPYQAREAGFGLPGGGVGGRVRFEDTRLTRLGFASIEVVWKQIGPRFVLQELAVRGEDLSPWRCRRLPLEQLLHDAATEIPRSMYQVEVDGQWQFGSTAAAMLRSASLAAKRGRKGVSDHVVERNESILRRKEAGETLAQLADAEHCVEREISRRLRAAKGERLRNAGQQLPATGGHRKPTPS